MIPSNCLIIGMSSRLQSLGNFRSAVEAGLVRVGRLRHIIPVGDVSPSGEAVLRSAFEGRLS